MQEELQLTVGRGCATNSSSLVRVAVYSRCKPSNGDGLVDDRREGSVGHLVSTPRGKGCSINQACTHDHLIQSKSVGHSNQ